MRQGSELFLALRKEKTKSVDRLDFSGMDHARYVKYLYPIR